MKTRFITKSRLAAVLSILAMQIGLSACCCNRPKLPDLIVSAIEHEDPATGRVRVRVHNIGEGNAGPFMVYVEINANGASDSAKPQSQWTTSVGGLVSGGSWDSPWIALSSFSIRGNSITLPPLTGKTIVATADAKVQVKEKDETNNTRERMY